MGSGHVSASGKAALGRSCRADPLEIPIDPNENLSTKTEGADSWTYEWNAHNELTRVLKNGEEQARFVYGPVGRRVEKVATVSGGGTATTSYTYDEADIIRESTGAVVRRYVRGLATDEPLAVDAESALTFFHQDALGSIVRVTNNAGDVVSTRQHDPWGGSVGDSGPALSFTGR
jgi:hypothetical protein